MSDITIESGTPEAVALRLMQVVLHHDKSAHGKKEELLKLYQECLGAVRGPVSEDLMSALTFEE